MQKDTVANNSGTTVENPTSESIVVYNDFRPCDIKAGDYLVAIVHVYLNDLVSARLIRGVKESNGSGTSRDSIMNLLIECESINPGDIIFFVSPVTRIKKVRGQSYFYHGNTEYKFHCREDNSVSSYQLIITPNDIHRLVGDPVKGWSLYSAIDGSHLVQFIQITRLSPLCKERECLLLTNLEQEDSLLFAIFSSEITNVFELITPYVDYFADHQFGVGVDFTVETGLLADNTQNAIAAGHFEPLPSEVVLSLDGDDAFVVSADNFTRYLH